ncbi:MAG: alpha/beta fold hydrolase, partial [Planctomycetota bacterium]
MDVRTYGESGRALVLLHGGPGAVGYMAPVARKLADRYRVWEPLQSASTVARHIADLHGVVRA